MCSSTETIKKFFLSRNGKNSPKATKTALAASSMLLTFLQDIMRKNELFLKVEMSYDIVQEHSQEYFQPKIGRKISIKIFNLGRENHMVGRVHQLRK